MADGIIGREAEQAAAGRLWRDLGRGPAALLLEGEAGIGKTVLWRTATTEAAAGGCLVLSTRPTEAEAQLSYAGLSDLLADAPDRSAVDLPTPQRRALEIALLQADDADAAVDQRAVSMAALGVIRAAASSGSVVIAVDDVQWLDGPTARILGFVMRRLRDEPVGVLATLRVKDHDVVPRWLEGAFASERTQVVRVGPLSLGAMHHVLRQRLGSTFHRSVLVRLHQACAGNPFVALEIGRAFKARGAELRPDDVFPIPDNVRDLVHDRSARLPVRTRRLLVLVAAMSQPTVDLVRRAAERPELVDADLDKATRAGIVEIEGGRIRFTHPLLASVPYSQEPADERRRLHRRLAEAVVEPEERARHLALGASGPDVDVAAAIDEAARRAKRRGAPDAAAELSELARALTPSDRSDDAHARAVEAAEYRFTAGDVERARTLLEEVVDALPAGPARADALRRLATVRYHQDGFDPAAELLLEARGQTEGDPWVTATIDEALVFVEANLGRTAASGERARSALALAEQLDDRSLLARSLTAVGFTGFLLGRGIDDAIWERAVALERFTDDDPPERRPSVMLATVRAWWGDADGARERLEVAYRRCEDRGDEQALPIISYYRCLTEWTAGRWELAAQLADEALDEAERVGNDAVLSYVLSSSCRLNAALGRLGPARAAGRRGLSLAQRVAAAPAVLWNLAALGFAELSAGDAAAAHGFLGSLADGVEATGVLEPSVFPFLPDDIEALVSLGELDRAEAHVAWLRDRGEALNRTWALAASSRCQALIHAARGDIDAAQVAVREALEVNERLPMPFELGRTLLCQGQVARRAKKKREAREALERALGIFGSLPAPLWADKTHAEIARIAGRRPATTALTEGETRVAELVAAGRTNREAADALFISVSTVEAHLKRIYRKVDVRSRTELAHHLSQPPSPVAPR